MQGLEERVLKQAIIKGNFKLASGNYSDIKFDFDKISQTLDRTLFDQVASALGYLIGNSEIFLKCNTILTVAEGANPLAEPVAKEVSKSLPHNIHAIKTKKDKNDTIMLRNPKSVLGLNCAIVDDVYTHGTNSSQVANLLTELGACVLGAAVVLNRNADPKPQLDVDGQERPIISLIHHDMPVSSTTIDRIA